MTEFRSTLKDRLASPRTVLLITVVLFVFAMSALFSTLVASRSALITADPYSYLVFAQEIADGNLHLTGPLAEAIAAFAENDELMQGPIWNTNVRDDGVTVFTIALGYPLFLAVMLKLGGVWLYTHVNIGLLFLVVMLLVYCVWEGWDRSVEGLAIGAAVGLAFIHTHPQTFLQFANPWREPLFYFCVLGGIAGLLLFRRNARLLPLGVGGVLLGYACAIKEANAIYAMWLGLGFLCSPAWRKHPRKWQALVVFVGAGVIGVVPLLIQNAVANGNPLLSMQFMRATSNYAVQGVAAGLNTHNVGNTLDRYIVQYGFLPWFNLPVIVLAGIGLVASLRRPVVRMFAGIVALHLALYFQWGNADYRHTFFAHIPYAVFVVAGAAWILLLVPRWVPALKPYHRWFALIPLVAVASLGSPWRASSTVETFDYEDAIGLVRELREGVEEDAVMLSNRYLRDVLGVYGRFPVTRLHELAIFHPGAEYQPVIEWLQENEYPVYFLDNTDLDPKNVGRVNWGDIDREWLLEYNDLVQVREIDRQKYQLAAMTDRPALTVYRVEAWERPEYKRVLPVPPSRAVFLYCNVRAATQTVIRIEGEVLPANDEFGYYRPVNQLALTDAVNVSWSGPDGMPVPAMEDLRLVSWTDVIAQECRSAAAPPDLPWLPDRAEDEVEVGDRRLSTPFVIRPPLRQGPGLFTTIGIGMNLIEDATNLQVYASVEGGEKCEIKLAGSAAWFPVVGGDPEEPAVTTRRITISSSEEALFKLSRLKSLAALRHIEIAPEPGLSAIAIQGRLTPDQFGEGPHPWTLSVDGQVVDSGRCFDDPRRSINAFDLQLGSEKLQGPVRLAFDGAGLIGLKMLRVRDELEARPGEPGMAFVSGVYGPERNADGMFCWTHETTTVLVPVGEGEHGYRLTMRASDGHPATRRKLTVQWGGERTEVELPLTPGEVQVELAAAGDPGVGLRPLELRIAPWSPAKLAGVGDDRELGFMLYQLRWEPIRSEAGSSDPADRAPSDGP